MKSEKETIRLRAYHPTYMVCYFGNQEIASEDHNKNGFDYVYKILKDAPDTMVELVKEFDDICLRCKKLIKDQKGSAWGKEHSCTSSRNKKVVHDVHESSLKVLEVLGLEYGSKMQWSKLVKLLSERIPRLDDPMIGGLANQNNYENGLKILGVIDWQMKLRPHHLIDVFKHFGNGWDMSKLHPYGHSQHLVARKILDNPNLKIELICENDDICAACRHLNSDNNTCDDMLTQLTPPIPKQIYNDELDERLFKMLKIKPGYIMTAKKFLETILSRRSDIVPLVTHPRQDEKYTQDGLLNAREALNLPN